jgi:hypothetical protein
MNPCTKKIMPNMTVQKLKMLLQRIFKASTPISYLGIISSQVRNSNLFDINSNQIYQFLEFRHHLPFGK